MSEMQFGKDFLWGGGFAANQMEGAAFEDGKGLCVADINEYQKDIPLEKRNNAEITTAVIQNADVYKRQVRNNTKKSAFRSSHSPGKPVHASSKL